MVGLLSVDDVFDIEIESSFLYSSSRSDQEIVEIIRLKSLHELMRCSDSNRLQSPYEAPFLSHDVVKLFAKLVLEIFQQCDQISLLTSQSLQYCSVIDPAAIINIDENIFHDSPYTVLVSICDPFSAEGNLCGFFDEPNTIHRNREKKRNLNLIPVDRESSLAEREEEI